MTPCIDVYKENIISDGSLEKLKVIIVVRGNIKNKDLIRNTLSPTSSIRSLKHFLSYDVKNNARVHQMDLLDHSYRPKLRMGYL